MNEAHNPQAYQTGPTTPPKSRGGWLAVVLIAAIFLTGLMRLLQLMNIPLFRLTSGQPKADISAITHTQAEPLPASYHTPRSGRGIQGQKFSAVCRNYYHIPQGVYLTFVEETTDFYANGLRIGDILLEIDGVSVSDPETLDAALEAIPAGQTVQLRYYRQGKHYEISVKLTHGGQ